MIIIKTLKLRIIICVLCLAIFFGCSGRVTPTIDLSPKETIDEKVGYFDLAFGVSNFSLLEVEELGWGEGEAGIRELELEKGFINVDGGFAYENNKGLRAQISTGFQNINPVLNLAFSIHGDKLSGGIGATLWFEEFLPIVKLRYQQRMFAYEISAGRSSLKETDCIGGPACSPVYNYYKTEYFGRFGVFWVFDQKQVLGLIYEQYLNGFRTGVKFHFY